jgi:hypothetical protein
LCNYSCSPFPNCMKEISNWFGYQRNFWFGLYRTKRFSINESATLLRRGMGWHNRPSPVFFFCGYGMKNYSIIMVQ